MKINSPKAAHGYFVTHIKNEVEEFWAIALGPGKMAIRAQCLFRGTVDQCLFHPRDVFRFAYGCNASSLIVAHNHPSGDIRPSREDREITTRLVEIGTLMQVPVIDHIILDNKSKRYFSFVERGLLRPEESIGPFRRAYL